MVQERLALVEATGLEADHLLNIVQLYKKCLHKYIIYVYLYAFFVVDFSNNTLRRKNWRRRYSTVKGLMK